MWPDFLIARPTSQFRAMPTIFLSALLVASPLLIAGSASAQDATEETQTDEPQVRVLPPAYEQQMLRLSEVLGALHYLRELCGANEGQEWREQMSNLIEQEEPTEERKAQMIARFNKGFRGFQEIYRECTPAAAEATNRYVREGVKLSAEITSRFGN